MSKVASPCKEVTSLPTNSEMRKPKHSWLQNHIRARRVLKPRPPDSLPISNSRIGESARALTSSPTLHSTVGIPPLPEWPIEHCANEPHPFLCRLASSSVAAMAPLLAVAYLCMFGLPAYSAVHQVESIGLTVKDLDGEVRFFTHVLSFEEVSRTESKGQAADDLLGLQHADPKVARLKLGNENITLTEHETKGRPVPPDSRSYDHWFQHIAIVVRDMDKAYEHLRLHKVKYVSTAPQTLPEWNKGAAGIKAFYFRDPEDHALEIIWFPPGKGDPKWQKETDRLFLGIDHTAIVVSDTEKSLELYRDLLGMRVAGESENFGLSRNTLTRSLGLVCGSPVCGLKAGPESSFSNTLLRQEAVRCLGMRNQMI